MAEELSFYDVKTKKKFSTSDYRLEDKAGRKFAEANFDEKKVVEDHYRIYRQCIEATY